MTFQCLLFLLALFGIAQAIDPEPFYIASPGFSNLENTEILFQIYGVIQDDIGTPQSGTISISFPSLEAFDKTWNEISCSLYPDGREAVIPITIAFLDDITSMANIASGTFTIPNNELLPKKNFRVDCSMIAPSASIREVAQIDFGFDDSVSATCSMNVSLGVRRLADAAHVEIRAIGTLPPHKRNYFVPQYALPAEQQGYLYAKVDTTRVKSYGISLQFDENVLVDVRDPACTVSVSSETPITVFAKTDYRLVSLNEVSFMSSRDVAVECPGIVVTRPDSVTESTTIIASSEGQNPVNLVFGSNASSFFFGSMIVIVISIISLCV